jgi:serine/threonine protein kinase/Leucine-rich repeat (LRR) protein
MNPVSACPSRQDLEALVQGQMPFTQVDQLAQHLEKCAACAQTISGLKVDDTLVEVIRRQATMQGKAPDAVLKNVMERLRLLRTQPSGQTAGTSQTGGVAPNVDDPESYDFLSAPQGPDELGRLGPYRVLKVLGAGGMGVVFEAEDPQLRRKVALKAMKPALAASATAKQRFVREAQSTAAIKHDHIVTIYQVGEDRGIPFLAMEFLEGAALDAWLKKGRQPTLAQILRIGREMARGLAAAHQRGLIHRDIKPANVWLEAPQGRVKILDFGLARGTKDDSQLTQSGAIVGTPAYMSPEQANGHKVDHRTDLFSLGCVLYRLCTGQMPFKGENTMATLMCVVSEHPRPAHEVNAKVPRVLSDLVMQLLAKDPAGRPDSARDVIEAIQAIEREQPAAGGKGAAAPNPAASLKDATQLITQDYVPPRSWRRPLLGAAAASLLFLAVAAGVIFVQTDKGTLKIDTVDADVQVVVEQNGNVIAVLDKKTGREVKLRSGEYSLKLGKESKDVRIDKGVIQLTRGETVVATITKVKGEGVAEIATRTIKTFGPADKPITQDGVKADQGGWQIVATHWCTPRLFEVPMNTGGQAGMLTYRARIKSEKLEGRAQLPGKAYLMMWCRIPKGPDTGEFVSKGLASPVQGTTDWASYEIPFRLEKGQQPDLLKLNVAIEGTGTLWIKDIEVRFTPFDAASPNVPAPRADIDLLKVIDPQKHAIRGKWAFDGSVLTVQKEKPTACIQVPYVPPEEYEVEAIATRIEGGEGGHGVVIGLVAGGRQFYAMVDDYGGSASGLAMIDRKTIADNETLHRGRVLITGKPSVITCRVHREGVLVRVDDRVIIDWKGDFGRLALHPGWKLPDSKQLFLGTTNATFQISKLVLRPSNRGVSDEWVQDVQKRPAEKQVEAVAAKLKELNPDFDGKMDPVIQDGKVLKLTLRTDVVTNLSPLRALRDLYWLSYRGSAPRAAKFTDLTSLRGTSISHLDLLGTQVADLTPLRGLPIVHLNCAGTLVTDLSAVEGMKLVYLNIGGQGVRSLSPLKGMSSLSSLVCNDSLIDDLSPLVGLRLETFGYVRMSVRDISVLRDMPLQNVGCSYRPERDQILRSIKTLQTINDKPAVDFWKEVDSDNAAFEQWVNGVQKLPAEKQVEAVAAKLQELNPGFDGKVTHKLHGNDVSYLQFHSDQIANLAPVRALKKLEVLDCSGSYPRKGILADLSPLRGMSLHKLYVNETKVKDLTPLSGLPLTELLVGDTSVDDLAPLRGMKLKRLGIYYGGVKDLSPLQGMPLTELVAAGCPISDLSPLRGAPLRHLECFQTKVKDFSPLRGMPLQKLLIHWMKADDLSVLRGMPLKTIRLDYQPASHADLLRSLWPLETINEQPAREFWNKDDPKHAAFLQWIEDTRKLPAEKQLEEVRKKLMERNPGFDGKVSHKMLGDAVDYLSFPADAVTDISPVRALPKLRTLSSSGSAVGKGKLADLTPLQGLALVWLNVHFNPITDLTPIRFMPLKQLTYDANPRRDAEVLRSINTLDRVNNTPVAEFLKGIE